MGKLVTSNFSSHNAKQFVESINETANSIYYVFLGKHNTFEGFGDSTPPTQNNSPEDSFYQPYRDMMYGKQVTTTDVRHMVANNIWTSGTVYAQYDHRDGALKDKKFYVHVEEANGDFSVFKCLGNNKGAPSTAQPSASQTSANDDIYITTSDRYQWKLMYEIPLATYKKFSTSKKIPIVENANVSGNAVSGAIDFVTVNSGGTRYNSVANGVVKVTKVGGNTRVVEIASLVSANVVFNQTDANNSGTFTVERLQLFDEDGSSANPDTSNNVANAVIVEANNSANFLRVQDIAGDFFGQTSNVIIRGMSSGATAKISTVESEESTLSANSDFYKESNFYISAGSGAGASARIAEYIVTGSARRIVIANDTGFATSGGNMLIDTTSRFEITPTVTIDGDGQGAEARAIVNTQIGAVDTIEVTKRGNSYTYATATVIGNTGIVGSTTNDTANVTVIIGPKGGHGSDAVNELYSDTVGISVDFANSEGAQIPAVNDFRQIGIIKDPLFNDVTLTLSNVLDSSGATASEQSFTTNEFVQQGNNAPRANAHFYTANISLSNVTAAGSNTAFIKEGYEAYGKFSNGDLYNGNNDPHTAAASGVSTTNLISNGVITFANSTVIEIHEDTGTFFENESNLVMLGLTSNVMAQVGSSNKNVVFNGATGRIKSRADSQLGLTNVYGQFFTSTDSSMKLTGVSSNVTADVVTIRTSERSASTFKTFDQRIRLTGFAKTTTDKDFVIDEAVIQPDTNAHGIIHSINTTSGSILTITNKKGNWLQTDTASGTEYPFRGQTSEATGTFTGVEGPDIVPNSGEIMYLENISAITRSDDQTERIKLMIEF